MIALLLVVAAQVTPPAGLVLFVLEPQQSNGSGRAPLASAPAQYLTPHLDVVGDVDVFNYGNDDQWHNAVEPIDSATGQVDSISVDATAAFGPSRAFADAYVELHPGVKVGLIPCANGGMTIHQWRRQGLTTQVGSNYFVPLRSSLYGNCMARIRAALASVPDSVLGGAIGFQGESDARPSTAYAQPTTYAAELVRWVKVLRADLNMPALPFVFAQLGPTPTDTTLTAWDTVKAQQVIARNSLTHVAMITTDDLTPLDSTPGNSIHFNAASYVEIGIRFAEAMTAVENQP